MKPFIEVKGLIFQVTTETDDDAGKPWDRECGHGPVRIVKANFTGYASKRPGEIVMAYASNQDGWAYDFAEAVKTARRESWGLDDSDAVKLAERLGRTPTRREVCAEAARLDMERMLGWLNDDWSYVGVVVTAPSGETASLWGIESDSGDGFIDETARELAEQLAEQLAEDLPDAIDARARSKVNAANAERVLAIIETDEREAAHAAMPARLALALAALLQALRYIGAPEDHADIKAAAEALADYRAVLTWQDTQRDLTEVEAKALRAVDGEPADLKAARRLVELETIADRAGGDA